mgnify:CR=1 FL=1
MRLCLTDALLLLGLAFAEAPPPQVAVRATIASVCKLVPLQIVFLCLALAVIMAARPGVLITPQALW